VVEVIEARTPRAPTRAAAACVELRGQVLPVVSLRTTVRAGRRATEARQRGRAAGRRRVATACWSTCLLGQHQTVIKPLGRMFRSLRGMSGSSILGNGEVALIFDVPR
jgi:two-component system chemotaxis sensor kinase CheA